MLVPRLCRVRLTGLGDVLRLSADQAQQVAAAEPGLLTFRHQDIVFRLKALGKELGLNGGQVKNLVCRRPGVQGCWVG